VLKIDSLAFELVGGKFQARESRDSPILNPFWRVAPSLRLSVLPWSRRPTITPINTPRNAATIKAPIWIIRLYFFLLRLPAIFFAFASQLLNHNLWNSKRREAQDRRPMRNVNALPATPKHAHGGDSIVIGD
jgi:hypothetical protein